jgi:hypothetical protein
MFNLQRRVTGYPTERVRQTLIVLQPGDVFRQPVDLDAIYDVSDLGAESVIFSTSFFNCSVFAGVASNSFELVSAPIIFQRAP